MVHFFLLEWLKRHTCQKASPECLFAKAPGLDAVSSASIEITIWESIPIQGFATTGTVVVLLRTLTRHYTGPDSPPGGRSHTRLACVTVSYTQITDYKRHRMWLPRIPTQGDC